MRRLMAVALFLAMGALVQKSAAQDDGGVGKAKLGFTWFVSKDATGKDVTSPTFEPFPGGGNDRYMLAQGKLVLEGEVAKASIKSKLQVWDVNQATGGVIANSIIEYDAEVYDYSYSALDKQTSVNVKSPAGVDPNRRKFTVGQSYQIAFRVSYRPPGAAQDSTEIYGLKIVTP